MSDAPAISIRSVSKKYRLYSSPSERLKEVLHPFRKQYHREFWALRDISFDVPVGATLGIIGRNGSGKSTLLQIICSILRPTHGEVSVCGRVSALLELGAGFNPQFTGRDNAIFNGQLMGLSRAGITARMPEIEAFADIGEFIDQPVKTYSSGMFVRLAFACAIQMDPDILLVDEALAVGDAKFQEKCFRKFREFQQAGKTVVFVTHDMNAIVRYCDYGMLLEQGKLVVAGDQPKEIVHRYLDLLEGRIPQTNDKQGSDAPPQKPATASDIPGRAVESFLAGDPSGDCLPLRPNYNKDEYRQGFDRAEVVDCLLVSEGRCDPSAVSCGQVVDVYIKARFHEPIAQPVFGLCVKTVDGLILFGYHTGYAGLSIASADAGQTVTVKFSLRMNVAPGDVFFDIGIAHKTSNGEVVSLDRRCASVHLAILENRHFDGVTMLDPEVTVASVERSDPSNELFE